MPARKKVDDATIVNLIRKGFTAAQIGREVGFSSTGNIPRLKRLAQENGLELNRDANGDKPREEKQAEAAFQRKLLASNARKHIQVDNGKVLIGSDAHFWPGIKSTAFRAFCKFAAELKPSAVVMNGDGFDGASISRYPRIGWDTKPKVAEELQACTERMTEIEEASGTKNLYWPLGNHDSRFETFLAANAPQYEGVDGFHLKDRFPMWIPCWSVWINERVVVKHRYKAGDHATHNNTLRAGTSIATGHLHSLKVTPYTDYNGTRFGIDCGTLADPSGPQFVDYLEDNPVNWRSGFVVLTFHKGQLLWPEVCHVIESGQVEFRGSVYEV